MKVGVPKEVKNHEYRVAITPAGVHELVRDGHEVYVQQNAGTGSSIPDGTSWPLAPASCRRRTRSGRPAS